MSSLMEDRTEGVDGFEIRRNNRLALILGVASSALAIAYLARATEGSIAAVFAMLFFGALGASQLRAVFDARVPLVTADDAVVRIRLGREWLGLPWSTIEQVMVENRDTTIRDGRLVIVPRNLGNALEALPLGSRREVEWQRRLHGAPLAVPLSIATRNVGVVGSVAETLAHLSKGRAEIVSIRGERAVVEALPEQEAARDRADLVETSLVDSADMEPTVVVAYRKPLPLETEDVVAAREARPVMRADVVLEKSRTMPGVVHAAREVAADAMTPVHDVRGEVLWHSNRGVVPAESARTPLVHEIIIGSLIREARERAALSVDTLAERTAIRPHVIEGIERDEFTACGGDFYARGHLRTLARFLGLNPGDLVDLYDQHYARGPISARRVFEAELATSLGTGVRARSGGPRWSLVAAAVLALLMVWGIARFVAPQGAPVNSATLTGESANPKPSVKATPITSPLMKTSTVVIGSLAWNSQIVVTTLARPGHPAAVVWTGGLRSPKTKTLTVSGPFVIQASQATLTTVSVDGQDMGKVGTQDGSGSRTFK